MPKYDYTGPIGSDQLAQVLGYWEAKKHAHMTLEEVPPPAPISKLRRGVTMSVGADNYDGEPFVDLMQTARVFDSQAGSYTDDDFPIPRPGGRITFLMSSGGFEARPGKYRVRWNPDAGKDYSVEVSDRGTKGPQPSGPIARDGVFEVKPGHNAGIQVQIVAAPNASGVPIEWLTVVALDQGFIVRNDWLSAFRFAKVIRCLSWQPLFNGGSGFRGAYTPPAPTNWPQRIEAGNVDPEECVLVADQMNAHLWLTLPDGQTKEYYQTVARRLSGADATIAKSNEWTFEAISSDDFHRTHERAKASGSFTAAQLQSGEARVRQGTREAVQMIRWMRETNPNVKLALECHQRNPQIARWMLDEATKLGAMDTVRCIAPAAYWYSDSLPVGAIGRTETAATAFGDGVRVTLDHIRQHTDIARDYGVETWVYEMGPHPTGQNWKERADFPHVLAYLHDDAKVAEHAKIMLDGLEKAGVTVACWMGGWVDERKSADRIWFSSSGPDDLSNPKLLALEGA